MKKIEDIKIKIFSDGADKKNMLDMNSKTFIKGFTTNPSLMKKTGIKDYRAFAKDIINKLKLINYDLNEHSLDTVKKFYKDAVEANFKL